ncbi:MAG: DUF975 family protein [Acetatifactor sp.]|nr:DUF975 family protein [Acetatifactor sp.]
MTWTRAELKAKAKAAFKRNYWKCVLVALIVALVTPNGGTNSSKKYDYNQNRNSNYNWDYSTPQYHYNFSDSSLSDSPSVISTGYYSSGASRYSYGSNSYYAPGYGQEQMLATTLGSMAVTLVIIIVILASALSILIFNPLQVGGCAFFIENAWINSAGPGLLLQAFKNNYKTTILTMFLRNLYTGLWSLLFIIPGIVKAYEYRMIPYLLADHPEMSHQDAFYESKRMMTGYKMEAFVLDLSFFGWRLLSALTLNLLGIFYVNPYIYATNAELYLALKRDTN